MRWSLRTEEDLARWIGKKRQRLGVAQCPECGTRSNWVLQSWRGARSWGSGFIFKMLGSHLRWIWEYRSGSRETGVG